jgi:N4-(beta-N-acetylglucosaminyl)-L-asparaginase
MKRREFIKAGAAAAGAASFISQSASTINSTNTYPDEKISPVVIASANGINATSKAYDIIIAGHDALDAVIAGVNLLEDDPNDNSVGLGGLPNEDGVVELDSCCMHGPTHNAGAVAAIRNIRNPSKVARLVMERTDHVLLVGEGALRFAKRHGFEEENLLTDEARKTWLHWKENLSDNDDWFPPEDKVKDHSVLMNERLTGTINCNALDLKGNLSGVTTTSGLSYKIPGRVGDSPIIGAGLYVDNEVGACGSTGRGEENLKNLSSFMVVEYMRMGQSPQEACLSVCTRIVNHAKSRFLKNEDGEPNFNVKFYAINRMGEFGSAAIKGPYKYSICDANGVRHEDGAFLMKFKS